MSLDPNDVVSMAISSDYQANSADNWSDPYSQPPGYRPGAQAVQPGGAMGQGMPYSGQPSRPSCSMYGGPGGAQLPGQQPLPGVQPSTMPGGAQAPAIMGLMGASPQQGGALVGGANMGGMRGAGGGLPGGTGAGGPLQSGAYATPSSGGLNVAGGFPAGNVTSNSPRGGYNPSGSGSGGRGQSAPGGMGGGQGGNGMGGGLNGGLGGMGAYAPTNGAQSNGMSGYGPPPSGMPSSSFGAPAGTYAAGPGISGYGSMPPGPSDFGLGGAPDFNSGIGGPDAMSGMHMRGGMGGNMGGAMGGGMGGGPMLGGGGPPSRALVVHHVPPEATYEELFDSVGAYGNLESIKLLHDRRQAFINFVDVQSAYHLMMSTGGQIALGGKGLPIMWARMRPIPRDLVTAIRQGATRNLYVANVPDSASDDVVSSLFTPFGELESVRLVPKKRAAFVNYANVTSALKAKEAMHCKVLPREPNAPADPLAKPILINFTSAQQNCMRARGGPSGGWGGGSGGGSRHDGGGRGRHGGYDRGYGHDRYDRYERSGKGGGGYGRRGEGRAPREPPPPPARSRALYVGGVPDAASLEELASLVEGLAVLESLRLVREKSCAFLNFTTDEVAAALYAKFALLSQGTLELHGKALTVNYAKARPCTEDHLSKIETGARRKLRLLAPASLTPSEARKAPGIKGESILGCEVEAISEEEIAAAVEAAAAAAAALPAYDASPASNAPVPDAPATDVPVGEAPSAADDTAKEQGDKPAGPRAPPPPPAHALIIAFSSVTAAMGAKSIYEGLSGEVCCCPISYFSQSYQCPCFSRVSYRHPSYAPAYPECRKFGRVREG